MVTPEMPDSKSSKCPHVAHITMSKETLSSFVARAPNAVCDECQRPSRHLWLCLHQDCHFLGCGAKQADHSSGHQKTQKHPLSLNLCNRRIWCNACGAEVFEGRNSPSFRFMSGDEPLAASADAEVADSSSEDEEEASRRGLTGLRNLGNTCYMNAAIQALSNCPQLTMFFTDCADLVRYSPLLTAYGIPRKATTVSSAYKQLIHEIWSKRSSPVITPASLLQAVRVAHPAFKGFAQQDSQEFLRFFMDQIHEEIKQPVRLVEGQEAAEQSPAASDADMNDAADAEDAVSVDSTPSSPQDSPKPQRRFKSIITDIFNGSLSSVVQCQTCEKRSVTAEVFQDLSLPIPSGEHLSVLQKRSSEPPAPSYSWVNPLWLLGWFKNLLIGPRISLSDCLEAFFSSDELKDDNMYSCAKCKMLRNGVKFSRLLTLPEVLCVHLKRFRHDFSYSAKISAQVTFPLEGLCLDAYLHRDCRSRGVLYDLVAVICHHGGTSGGHYTTLALNHRNQQWYEFDDSFVTRVDVASVEAAQAYVLFYRKREQNLIPLRLKAVELMKTSHSDGLMTYFISRQWINKFNTFGAPGPITNEDIQCPHGALPPAYAGDLQSLALEVPYELWGMLVGEFGGGPIVTRLRPCALCQAEEAGLAERRRAELDRVVGDYRAFRSQPAATAVYALSSRWFKTWEDFARGREVDPPGPIDNSSIVSKRGELRPNADYYPISRLMWGFFLQRYGGGPEVCMKEEESSASEESPAEPDIEQD